MSPYGLTHQVRLPEAFTAPLPDAVYDPATQLHMIGGAPLVHQPELMQQRSVTWGTPRNDNKTDDGG
ncbi:hypothetical protein ACFHW2_11680 [Actinomadura sp. LOL_016]|uniref:hypothetical protein n=1 Tax=unclassified Actinomadura TaxID=2626254 RepID=UPI003A7FED4B